MIFYNTNGIPSLEAVDDHFYITENILGDYIFKDGDITFDLEKHCIELRNTLAVKIFGSLSEYHKYFTSSIYPMLAMGGIDAELRISKEDFERVINIVGEKEQLNKLLYFFDVENLISTLQNSILETKILIGQFYKTLNTSSFLIKEDFYTVNDDFQYASGALVTSITSLVNHLFISLYSQLDFTTKIIFEFENLHSDFSVYPRLRSKDIVFGDFKRTTFKNRPNTIYELTSNLRTIMYLRNEIVHNASIDSVPKVYQRIQNSQIVEKFILLPDFVDGVIQIYKNRKRFFNNDTKLNEILPSIIKEFWEKLNHTLMDINNLE
jgi:hypothetical protein